MRDDIIFTTVCISDPTLDDHRRQFKGQYHYAETANVLINSAIKNTRHSIIVVTDVPEKFTSSDRVIVYDIKQLTDEPRLIQGYMNFHLKRYAMKLGFESLHKYVVYVDCDLFIENFNEDLFNWMDSRDVDIAGKLGMSDIRSMLGTPVCEEKIKQFGSMWSDDFLTATLPFELFFVFKKNQLKQRLFIDTWDKIAKKSLEYDIATIYDSYYIGVAIQQSHMNRVNLQQFNDVELLHITNNFFDGLLVIHSDHVCTFDIVRLEPFNYTTLLKRFSYAV